MSYLSSAFPRFAEHMEPHEIVFQLAKSGKARQLKQYLNRRTKEDRKRIIQNKYNGATSLIMACRNGHYDVVEYIVEHCNANLEQSGLVNFEGENIEGAPPLWCASAAGHLKIVKYLVSKGANVNSTTKSNSTALRAACFDGHVDIVKFLVENNADIEIANRHGHTCLMIACYKGHLAIAKYLIARGADLNRKSVKGNTALHDCAECGSLDIMKLLLSHQAKMAPDSYQMTPLLAAAVTGHSAIVEYLLTRNECQQVEKILALELLGATFVDKKHDMLSAYNYWKMALERRSVPLALNEAGTDETTSTETTTITTSSLCKRLTIKQTPIEAYDYATEFLDKEELDEIMSDPDEVRMQALLIRERILGPTHPDTTYYIRYRGAVYADCGNFRKCILLWLYALDTQQKSLEPLHPMIQSSFLSFTELFQYMQKQLSPFNSAQNLSGQSQNSRDTVNDSTSIQIGQTTSSSSNISNTTNANNESSMFNILNMYTQTVLKMLQQAVEEIKRGINLIKQDQTSNNTITNTSNNSCNGVSGISNQNDKNNNSINNTNESQSDGAMGGCTDSTSSSNRSDSGDSQNKSLKIDFNNKSSNVNSNADVTAKEMNKDPLSSPSCSPCSSSSSTLTPNDFDSLDESSSSSIHGPSTTTSLSNPLRTNNRLSNSTLTENSSTSNQSTSASTSSNITNPQINFDMAHFDRTLVVIVHFLVVVAESLRHCSPEETYKLKKLVYELIKLNPKNSKSSTLLHLASSRDSSSIIKNHTLSSFPSTEVLKLLLECGADPNSLDGERNSPLHLAASNRNSSITSANPANAGNSQAAAATASANGGVVVVGNVGTGAVAAAHINAINNASSSNVLVNSERDKIICLLLNSGTHLDACNANNKTAADLYKGGKMYNVINPINYVNLQCMAAKVIQKYKIPYREHLTLKLANFVSIH